MKPRSFPFQIRSNYTYGAAMKPSGSNYRDFPVRLSIPAPEGAYAPRQPMVIRDETGKAAAASITPFLHWPDGSVRAWEVWMPVTLDLVESRRYTLKPAAKQSSEFNVQSSTFDVPSRFRFRVSLSDGTALESTVPLPSVVEQFNLVSHREMEACFALAQADTVWFAGALGCRSWSHYPGLELAVRITNVLRGTEVLTVKSVRLEFDLPLSNTPQYTVRQWFHSRNRSMPSARYVRSEKPFTLRANHGDVRVTDITQLDENPSHYPPYERPGIPVVSYWLAAGDSSATWLLLVDEACERFPKQWTIQGNRVAIDLHPEDAHPLEWRQGMSMFQRIHLVQLPATASGDDMNNEAMAWQRPPIVTVDPDVYRAAGWRIPFAYDPKRFPKTENKFRDLFSFQWYPGTFYWGDESDDLSIAEYLALPPEQRPRARPRNGEYDITAAAAKEYARTGQGRFLRMCRNAAEHLMHTDFVAVSDDPWKEGGVPAHTKNHTSGAAYPSHMWVEGLTLYYQLTGDPNALRVARRIGQFIVKYARERGEIMWITPREGGWALIALGALYDLIRDEEFLDGIRLIVDSCLRHEPGDFCPTAGCFMVAIALVGLDRVRAFYRDADIRKFIPRIMDWQIENRMTPDGMFDIHFDAERNCGWRIESVVPEALNVAYKITGNEKYLRLSWRQYQFWDSGVLFHVIGNDSDAHDSRLAACAHLSWMGSLASFAEKGWLDQAQFPDPTRDHRA
jgi:hypothetical protein